MTGEDAGPDPTRVVADADVLAADLLVGGPARRALDVVRRHSWLDLVATAPLLHDAEAVVAGFADPGLADDWRGLLAARAVLGDQPAGDHPALAAALHGDAAHLLSFDERLRSARAGTELRGVVDVSVRSPDAFAAVFDPAAVYETAVGADYPGPDRDPRA